MSLFKLLKANREAEPKTYEYNYGKLVEDELEVEGYTVSKIQAILNNYLAEPENEKYRTEFLELQVKRTECKQRVREKLEK
jgi:hypothetical protein